jgi:PIN domain nuclease of toxin-antitoxin system
VPSFLFGAAQSSSASGHHLPASALSSTSTAQSRPLHTSAPLLSKVNPRNANQANLKEKLTFEAVRKRHAEMRQKKEEEEALSLGVRLCT